MLKFVAILHRYFGHFTMHFFEDFVMSKSLLPIAVYECVFYHALYFQSIATLV
jgi:hypothetical protein